MPWATCQDSKRSIQNKDFFSFLLIQYLWQLPKYYPVNILWFEYNKKCPSEVCSSLYEISVYSPILKHKLILKLHKISVFSPILTFWWSKQIRIYRRIISWKNNKSILEFGEIIKLRVNIEIFFKSCNSW